MATKPSTSLRWRKSSASGQGNCVEVAFAGEDEVFLRNSKTPKGPVVKFTSLEWDVFLIGVRRGDFDGGPR